VADADAALHCSSRASFPTPRRRRATPPDLDVLEKNRFDRGIAWKHGANGSSTSRDQRVLELKNWIERLVKPRSSKHGRG
jgi:hypothetical protein